MTSRSNLVVGIAAAAALAGFAWHSMTRQPAQPEAPVTAAQCTPEAIRAIGDAVERSIRSARCAQASK